MCRILRQATPQAWRQAPRSEDKMTYTLRELETRRQVLLEGISQNLNYTDRLVEIQLPTLIIVGENDMGTPVAASEVMHQRIAGSKLVVIGPAAHLSNIEQADKFNQSITVFLDGL